MVTEPTPPPNVDRLVLDQQEFRAQLGVLRRQVDQLVSLVQSQQQQLLDLTAAFAAVRSQVGQASQLEATVRLIKEVTDQLRAAQGELTGRIERLERLQGTETDQLRQAIGTIHRRLDEVGSTADLTRGRLDALAEAHRKQQESLAAVTKDVENWSDELSRIQGQLRAQPGLIQKVERDLAALRPEVMEVAAEQAAAANRIKALAEDLGRLSEAVEGFRQDRVLLDEARQAARELRNSFDILERRISGQEEGLQALGERMDRLEAGQRDLSHHLRNLEGELNHTRAQLKEALELNTRLTLAVLGLLENLTNLRIQHLQAELRQVREFAIRAREMGESGQSRSADEPA